MYAFSIASAQASGGPIRYGLHKELMLQPPWDMSLRADVSQTPGPLAVAACGGWDLLPLQKLSGIGSSLLLQRWQRPANLEARPLLMGLLSHAPSGRVAPVPGSAERPGSLPSALHVW